MTQVFRLAAALALLTAFGCQTTPARRPYDPFRDGTAIAIDDPAIAQLVATLNDYTRDRRSLLAAAKVSLEGPDVQLNRPQRIAVQRPASLRVEILGLFGQVAAILVTDGATYQLWDGSTQETTVGAVTPDLLWRVAQVDLSPAEAARLLLGDPTSGKGVMALAAVETPGGSVAVSLREDDAGGTRTVEFDAAGRVRRALRYDVVGTVLWDALFGDYREVGVQLLAHDVRIEFPSFDSRASFQLEAAELNRPLSASVFTLPAR